MYFRKNFWKKAPGKIFVKTPGGTTGSTPEDNYARTL